MRGEDRRGTKGRREDMRRRWAGWKEKQGEGRIEEGGVGRDGNERIVINIK